MACQRRDLSVTIVCKIQYRNAPGCSTKKNNGVKRSEFRYVTEILVSKRATEISLDNNKLMVEGRRCAGPGSAPVVGYGPVASLGGIAGHTPER